MGWRFWHRKSEGTLASEIEIRRRHALPLVRRSITSLSTLIADGQTGNLNLMAEVAGWL